MDDIMDVGRDSTLENLDRGFQESKNIQLLQFLNDQSEISTRLKTCRFSENSNGNNATGTFSPDSRVSTAPEAATRTHRLRPLSARPSTASGRQFMEPDPSERDVDTDNQSVVGRRRRRVVGVGRSRQSSDISFTAPSDAMSMSGASSPPQRPETVCGFLEEVEEEDEDDDGDSEGHFSYDVESDLDVLSIESITSETPCDDIDDEEVDGVTYEFDVPESDRLYIEAEINEPNLGMDSGNVLSSPLSPTKSPNKVDLPLGAMTISSPKRLSSSTRKRSAAKKRTAAVPNITSTSSNNRTGENGGLPHDPHPPSFHRHHLPLQKGGSFTESSATSKVLRHMRTRSTSSVLREQGPNLHSSSLSPSKFVWGDAQGNGPASERQPSSDLMSSVAMSPRISFEELPIEKQGVKLRTVARIDCDASFYRKLRHRSAPAMRTDELTTSRSETNSPVRPKPVGIYHLPPLSKDTAIQHSATSSSSPSTASLHPEVRSLTATEFLTQHQHKVVFQEPNLLH